MFSRLWKRGFVIIVPGADIGCRNGLTYNRFRYYSSEEGMCMSQDPIGLASSEFNLYSYVYDTSIFIDPLGLKSYSPGPRHNNVVSWKDKPKNSTKQLSEWRRPTRRADLKKLREGFLGKDHVKVGPGKWRSVDGGRQFRIGPSDYKSTHGMGNPAVTNQPHAHLEFLSNNATNTGFKVT